MSSWLITLIFIPWTLFYTLCFSSVQFSCSVVSDPLRPHEPKHARPPCPSPTPGVYPNSCPSSQWCHRAISSSVVPFSSCPQSLPASGSFPMSQLFAWGGQSTGVSASASVLPMIPGLISFRMDWVDLLAVQGTLKSLLQPGQMFPKFPALLYSLFSPPQWLCSFCCTLTLVSSEFFSRPKSLHF